MRSFAIAAERLPFFDRLVFVVFVLCIPFAFGGRPLLFGDGDVSWHIAAGRWIIANRQVPDVDPFSFSMTGQPWTAHEWLSEIILAGAFDFGGYQGLAAAVIVAGMLLHLIVFLHLRTRVGPVAMLLAFPALDLVLIPFILARPHVLIWPIVALWTSALLNARDGQRAPSLWLALAMLLWTNLHGSFVLGFVIAGGIGLDAMIDSRWDRALFTRWALFGIAAVIAALLNINGLAGFLHPLSIVGMDTLPLIEEWQPTNPASSPVFYAVVLITLGAMLTKGVKFTPGELLLLLTLLLMAFMQWRHQSWLAIIAVLIVTPRLAEERRGVLAAPAQAEQRRWAGAALVAALILLGIRVAVPMQLLESAGNPRNLIANIPPELRGRPVLNEYSFGGPLILAGIRPYIDGRADLYGDAFMTDYVKIVGGDLDLFDQAVCKHGIVWTMLPATAGLTKLLDSSSHWRRVHADEVGVIHARVSNGPLRCGLQELGADDP